jgi:hypothetical protein
MHSSHPTGLSKCVACQQYSAIENFHKELVCLHCGHVAVVEGPPFRANVSSVRGINTQSYNPVATIEGQSPRFGFGSAPLSFLTVERRLVSPYCFDH